MSSPHTHTPLFLIHDQHDSERNFVHALDELYRGQLRIIKNNKLDLALPYIPELEPRFFLWSYTSFGGGPDNPERSLQRFGFSGTLIYLITAEQETEFNRISSTWYPAQGFKREYLVMEWPTPKAAGRFLNLYF